jgi:uncharacterized protein (DUF433 family)
MSCHWQLINLTICFKKNLSINFEKKTMKQIISIKPDVLSGMPVFNGTRVPIKNLFDYLETGHTLETFLDNFLQ